jgi:hypothetical protein
VSIGTLFNAHRNILRINISARTYLDAPPLNYRRASPKHPKITLPYSSVVTGSAYTNYMCTLLLCNPNNLEWHFILLKAAYAFQIIFFNMVLGLLFALFFTNPKYLNSATFSFFTPLHLKMTSILIYIAFVFLTFIYKPYYLQNSSKASNIYCCP